MTTVPRLFITLTIIGATTTMLLAAVGSTLFVAGVGLMLTGFTGVTLNFMKGTK